jgi:ribonucrease Y
MAKRAGLLHDVGKTVDKSIEGPHALLVMILQKNLKNILLLLMQLARIMKILKWSILLQRLVQAADAISGARPGARREPLESYVKRLENLELLAKSFEGVAKTYAIQAGREVRVVVEHDKVDDIVAEKLAHDIASKLKKKWNIPGQIKVTVIREVRKIGYAK